MSVLPNSVYRFSATPIKVSASYLVEIDKMILKCGKDKTITLAKINLQKNKVGALSLPGFKIYYKAVVIKTH